MAASSRDRTFAVDLPQALWMRSTKPPRGMVVRWTSALSLVLLATVVGNLGAKIGLIAAAIAVFVGIPLFVYGRLARLARDTASASRSRAGQLVRELPNSRLVSLFAPYAWTAWQRGELHMRLGDGRAAAREFSEAARLCGQPKQPGLLAAQAHALTLSGDYKQAKPLLLELERAGKLRGRERVDLATTILQEGGRLSDAINHLENAFDSGDATPRTLAGLALAHARADDIERAYLFLDELEALEDVDDEVAVEMAKRTKKLIGRFAKPPRKPKRAKAKQPVHEAPIRASKVDRRKERRRKRKEQRAAEQAEKRVRDRAERQERLAQRQTAASTETADEPGSHATLPAAAPPAVGTPVDDSLPVFRPPPLPDRPLPTPFSPPHVERVTPTAAGSGLFARPEDSALIEASWANLLADDSDDPPA